MSFLTGTNLELIYANSSPGTAKASFTTEALLNDIAGMGPQAVLPQGFFLYPPNSRKGIRVVARGILSNVVTATPSYTFTLRGGASANITTAPILAGSPALVTTATANTNKLWEYEVDLVASDPTGSAGTTLRAIGTVTCPGAFASPFAGELWGGASQPGTIATFDPSAAQFINFNVACSASNASNSIQLLQLLVFGLN